ncbi:MAG: hypothetical protein LC131_07680 [Anaerolineae bacterium]|jgi:hypothetical protein|nr:hypothetical protein [Anaerolineae bacterium]
MATKVASLKLDPDTKVALADFVSEIEALRTAVAALKADHNTLVAKLNLDAGVTDVNYAVSTAATLSAVVSV